VLVIEDYSDFYGASSRAGFDDDDTDDDDTDDGDGQLSAVFLNEG
jgi:hypothetical protein